jgi:hypothetical protein
VRHDGIDHLWIGMSHTAARWFLNVDDADTGIKNDASFAQRPNANEQL